MGAPPDDESRRPAAAFLCGHFVLSILPLYSRYTPMTRSCSLLLGAALVATAALCISGCGGDAASSGTTQANLNPVRGKVVREDGSAVSGGFIEFNSEATGAHATGQIGKDGSFELSTMVDGQSQAGAPPGTYTVMVVLEDQSQLPLEGVTPYVVEAKETSITVQVRPLPQGE
jgi:hypothetical protein